MENPILKVNSLSFAYPDTPDFLILKDISFSLNKGEALGILGPNAVSYTHLTLPTIYSV